jgi:hypothetical protein
MELFESHTHSFVIKIWLEETVEEAGHAVWRGRITHVPSGKYCFVQDPGEIFCFIMPYLEDMGVNLVSDDRPTAD